VGTQEDHKKAGIPATTGIPASKPAYYRGNFGLARRRAQGKPIGGAASKRGKDKHPRRTEGYKQAWARRKAAQ